MQQSLFFPPGHQGADASHAHAQNNTQIHRESELHVFEWDYGLSTVSALILGPEIVCFTVEICISMQNLTMYNFCEDNTFNVFIKIWTFDKFVKFVAFYLINNKAIISA